MDRKAFGIPVMVWVLQLGYVVVQLVLLTILTNKLAENNESHRGLLAFAAVFVCIMIVANIVWRLLLARKRTLIVAATIVLALIMNVLVWQVFTLHNAHSSLSNYAKFRGCVSMLSQSDSVATCRLQSGNTIKMVKYNNKWYLDGDLPQGIFSL